MNTIERLTAENKALKENNNTKHKQINCAHEEVVRLTAENAALLETNARFAKRNLDDLEKMFVLEQEREALWARLRAAIDAARKA